MFVFERLHPKDVLDRSDLDRGLSMLMYDGVCTQVMGILTGGAFLVAFAVLLGASNAIIGLLAALGPLTQILQVPAIYLVDKIGLRKALSVVSSFISRLFWFVVAVLPWLMPKTYQVPILLTSLLVYFGLGTISGLSFSSWMRDLIPDEVRGSYSGKRMAISTAIAAGIGLAAGVGVDVYKKYLDEIGIYSIYFLAGGSIGLLGTYFLSGIPEPRMQRAPAGKLLDVVAEPLRDSNFRQLLIFLGIWSFAVNLAAPFFTVYMLKRLHLNMSIILGLSVLSQVVNVLFFRLWGFLADRFSNKSVLAESGPMLVITIALWPFTTMPEFYVLTIPLLVLIHVLAGMSTAGVMLCSANIALKLAPYGKATAYLAGNALISGFAATIAPVLGGLLASTLEGEELTLTFRWISSVAGATLEFPTLSLKGLDFLFILSFLFGLYSLHRLLAVREQGEVEKGIVYAEFRSEVRKAVRNMSNVAGMRDMFYFPYSRLREVMKRQ
jgi:MFS family permease